MGLSKQNGVSILELVIYFPLLVGAAVVCKRHGFGRSSGFIFTLILCLVRIVGACCELATIESDSKGLIETYLILQSVGLSPLLLATLGLLSRCADSIVTSGSRGIFSAIHFRLVQILVTVGMILSVAGGTSSIAPDGTYTPQTESKVGIALYIVALVALLLIALITVTKLSNGPKDDRRIAWVTIFALPFIGVRLLYAILSVFSNNKHFRPATGSVIIHVFMAILEEFIVILMYVIVGWVTSATAPEARGPIASRPWKGPVGGQPATNGGGGGGGGQRRSRGHSGRRQGPIHALVEAGIARTQQRGQEADYARAPRRSREGEYA